MVKAYNPRLVEHSQKLRRQMTKEERHLWYDFLKTLPVTFNRQKIIGNYIVDFYCASAKLVIELDGSQHYDEKGLARDAARNEALSDQGLTVLHYSNLDIQKRFDNVCEDILRHLWYVTSSESLRDPPSPQGEG